VQAIGGPRPALSPPTPAPLAAPADRGRLTLDDESRDWLHSLSADSRDEALVRLRALLLRAARFEVARRREQVLHVDDRDLDELARRAADAALGHAVARLDHYHGGSRFTTWAAKFALNEAAVRLRKLAWHQAHAASSAGRASAGQLSPQLLAGVGDVLGTLSAHQRHVFETLAVDGVPIDVLAEDLQTTRGDVYQTLQTVRGLLRGRSTRVDSA
jgi:RNA polymerase sigma-70 factor, ECF subfamily